MNKWLFRIHRWVGAVVGLFFLMWCLSGLVLVYHPFPNVDERDLQARMEPLPDSLPAVDSVAKRLPEGAAAKVRTVTVRRFQGQTLFDFETKDTTYTLCADSAAVQRPITAPDQRLHQEQFLAHKALVLAGGDDGANHLSQHHEIFPPFRRAFST